MAKLICAECGGKERVTVAADTTGGYTVAPCPACAVGPRILPQGGTAPPRGAWPKAQPIPQGVELRDYFAGLAMAALIAKVPLHDSAGEHGRQSTKEENVKVRGIVARSAYFYADSMIAAREARP